MKIKLQRIVKEAFETLTEPRGMHLVKIYRCVKKAHPELTFPQIYKGIQSCIDDGTAVFTKNGCCRYTAEDAEDGDETSQQLTFPQMRVDLFRHIHSLSLRWHLSRKTGEVTRIMDRGMDSINNLLNYILFSIAPCIVDILIAVVYFITNIYFGLIVFITLDVFREFHQVHPPRLAQTLKHFRHNLL